MIRHSSSFFFSLTFHTVLFVVLFFVWQNIPSIKKVDCEEKVCLKLSNVLKEKPIIKPIQKPKPKPKKVVKPKVKPKPIIKKVEIVKEEPVVVPKIIEEIIEPEPEEIPQEPKEIVKPVREVFITQVVEEELVVEEDSDTRQKRLEEDYLQEHIAQITKLLQDNLYYPRRARKRGTIGEVIVKFTLSTDAKAHSIKVLSSKSEILSRAAIKTIEDLSGEFPRPSEELILHVPINYSLTN